MNIDTAAVVVDFPLRGEWIAPNTPGKKVPSHGTYQYGEAYAYDFVKVDAKDRYRKFYDASPMEYLLHGVPLERCYGWGAEIYSPCDGEVVEVEGGVAERSKADLAADSRYTVEVTRRIKAGEADYKDVAGNYIVMRCGGGVYAAFAHLQAGSILVAKGQRIIKGQMLGRVGHSGNSTAPHLHFQLMDSGDIESAKGIPCAFAAYEVLRNGKWAHVEEGIPNHKEILRRMVKSE